MADETMLRLGVVLLLIIGMLLWCSRGPVLTVDSVVGNVQCLEVYAMSGSKKVGFTMICHRMNI